MEVREDGNPQISEIEKRMAELDEQSLKTLVAKKFFETFGADLPLDLSKSLLASITGQQSVVKPQPETPSAAPTDEYEKSNVDLPPGPEDEFVKAIKGTTIVGKFPTGLTVAGKEIVPPTPKWASDFTRYHIGPDIFDLPSKFAGVSQALHNTKELNNTSVIMSDLQYQDPEHRIIAVLFPQLDEGQPWLQDAFGRHIGNAIIGLRLTNADGQRLMKLIAENPDGADIAERLIQKTNPDIFSKGSRLPGIQRKELKTMRVITDEKALDTLSKKTFGLTAPLIDNLTTTKPYSKPVK